MSRRVPTRVKRLRGTLRRDRTNPREPRPLVGAPPCRRGLPAAVRVMYRRLVRRLAPLRVVTIADGLALELLASVLVEHDVNARVVLERGATYEATTEAGAILVRVRPESALAADAMRRATTLLAHFGLTPSSRSKVEVLPPGTGGADPMEQLLAKRAAAGDDLERFRRQHPRSKWQGLVP